MLIIARHTHTDSSKYHNVSGFGAAFELGVDLFSMHVRATKDNRLVLARHPHLGRDRSQPRLRSLTLKELQRRTAGSKRPVVTLQHILKNVFGSLLIEIVVEEQAAVAPLLEELHPYIKRKAGRDSVIVTSSNPFVLLRLRRSNPRLNLGMLHKGYPFTFLTWEPFLRLSVVGFHRLHLNTVAVEAAHKLKLFTYAYTVNRKKALQKLETFDIDAIATDTPERFV